MTFPPPAHGGHLRHLIAGEPPANPERLPILKLTPRQQCDVEMLLTGAFSPLTGFHGRDDYLAVLQTARLADGTLWPVPIVLDVDRAALAAIGDADSVQLLDAELHPVAVLELGESWQPDRVLEAKIVYGTDDAAHDGVRHLLHGTAQHYLSGRLRGIRLPVCRFQADFRHAPAQQRAELAAAGARASMGWFAFEPPDRGGLAELTHALHASAADHLLVMHSPHAAPTATPPARVTARCLAALLPRLRAVTRVSYCSVPLWPRWCGMREEVWHAIVCQNYGADRYRMNERGTLAGGRLLPPTQIDRELPEHAREELAIRMIAADGHAPRKTSGQHTAAYMGGSIDAGTLLPEVASILLRRVADDGGPGFALLLTGLSGAGKSSLAHALGEAIETGYGRVVTVLDGDYSRQLLTSELGGSAADQHRNVERHAFIGAEIVRHGGIAIIALVAPYAAARGAARRSVEAYGGFIEIYVSAPVAVCERRDAKGIYALFTDGSMPVSANIASHFEAPERPEIVADSSRYGTAALVEQTLAYLSATGYLAPLLQVAS